MIITAVERVEVVPDWLTYSSVGATVGAAVLALVSVVYSGCQARKAQRALLRERRADFELGLLAEMSRQFGITAVDHLHGHLWALIRQGSPPDDLPVLRAHFGRYPTPEGQAQLEATRESDRPEQQRAALHAVVRLEIEQAIERRLTTP